MKIGYFSSSASNPYCVQPLVLSNGCEWVDYVAAPDKRSYFASIEAFILFSPVIKEHNYLSCETIWERFLAKNWPHIKFLVAGFEHNTHSNYLDLLDFPENLHEIITEIETTNTGISSVPSASIDVTQKLKRFFDGHGDESLKANLNGISRKLHVAQRALKEEGANFEVIFQELSLEVFLTENWKTFINRWANYKIYFDALPFEMEVTEISKYISLLKPFFANINKEENLISKDIIEYVKKYNRFLL